MFRKNTHIHFSTVLLTCSHTRGAFPLQALVGRFRGAIPLDLSTAGTSPVGPLSAPNFWVPLAVMVDVYWLNTTQLSTLR